MGDYCFVGPLPWGIICGGGIIISLENFGKLVLKMDVARTLSDVHFVQYTTSNGHICHVVCVLCVMVTLHNTHTPYILYVMYHTIPKYRIQNFGMGDYCFVGSLPWGIICGGD